jgi:hypothetical protein
VRASGPEHLRPIVKIDLVIENVRWKSNPASVTLTHSDVGGQVAINRFVYSFARHTFLAHRAVEFLVE